MILPVNDLFDGRPGRRDKVINRHWNLDHVPQFGGRDQDALIRNVHVVYLGVGHHALLVF
jgi:hypothetical protein